MNKKVINETGNTYGNLLVLKYLGSENNNGNAYWLCKCSCGKTTKARGSALRTGKRYSCGCIRGNHLKKEPGIAGFNQLYNSYKNGAKRRNLVFYLTKKAFKMFVTRKCFYCGSKPNYVSRQKSENSKFLYNGIDRINNDDGYHLGNCLTCCKVCNSAKGKLHYQDFLTWIGKTYKNLYRGGIYAKS